MKADAAYAGFLERLGHRLVRTTSASWYDVNRAFFMSAPSHRAYSPGAEELQQVFRHFPCFGVRFAAPLQGPGKLSYQLVCDNSSYGLETLSANVRSKVRRGLKRCEVERASFATLASAGRRAQLDTLARQGREDLLNGDGWDRFWEAAAATPNMEGWAAWNSGSLAAFLVAVTFEESVEFMLARSCSAGLGAYPNNALIFRVTEEMLMRRRAREITFGLESLEPVGPLDEFKLGMGFRKRPLRQRVIFHPLVRGVLRPAAVRRVFRRWAERRGGEAVFWRKTAGLLRFAEECGL